MLQLVTLNIKRRIILSGYIGLIALQAPEQQDLMSCTIINQILFGRHRSNLHRPM